MNSRMPLLTVLLTLGALVAGCTTDVDSEEGEDRSALEGGEGDECEEGDARSCEQDGAPGTQHCDPTDEGPRWSECFVSSGSTPLVLSFDGRAVEYGREMRGTFDLTGLGVSVATDWPTAATPWLALDRDGNGTIDSGEELFGSASRLQSGGRADHGFQALSELDQNGDGRITASDPAFSSLVLWTDKNGDRKTDAGELVSLASMSIVALHVDFARMPRCDARQNCEYERASFDWRAADGTLHQGSLVDVHLAFQK